MVMTQLIPDSKTRLFANECTVCGTLFTLHHFSLLHEFKYKLCIISASLKETYLIVFWLEAKVFGNQWMHGMWNIVYSASLLTSSWVQIQTTCFIKEMYLRVFWVGARGYLVINECTVRGTSFSSTTHLMLFLQRSNNLISVLFSFGLNLPMNTRVFDGTFIQNILFSSIFTYFFKKS